MSSRQKAVLERLHKAAAAHSKVKQAAKDAAHRIYHERQESAGSEIPPKQGGN